MKKSPLHKYLEKINANFAESKDYIIAQNYGNTESEIENVREEIGFIDLFNRGKIIFSGKDHLKLLQGMLTNDVLKLENGSGIYACLLNLKGKIVSDMKIFKSEDSVYMDVEPGMNETVKNIFTKYKLSYRAEIEEKTDEYGLVHICGPKCPKIIANLFNIDNNNLKLYDHTNSDGIKIIKINRTGETGYDLIFPETLSETIWEKLEKNEIKPFGTEGLEILRIEAGIPVYGKDMDDTTIPIEADLWDTLDFEKGCYIGQEVIARIKWRGRVNWHLKGFSIIGEKIPSPGDKIIINEKTVGRITSSIYSKWLGNPIALGYIRREYQDYSDQIEILTNNEDVISAKLTEKKFYQNFN